MPDEYTNNMRNHLANCYQAGGLTPAGAEQVANHQQPSNPTDQAMLGAYSDPNFGMPGSNTNGASQPTWNQSGGTSPDQPAYPTPDPNHGYDSAADKGHSEYGSNQKPIKSLKDMASAAQGEKPVKSLKDMASAAQGNPPAGDSIKPYVW